MHRITRLVLVPFAAIALLGSAGMTSASAAQGTTVAAVGPSAAVDPSRQHRPSCSVVWFDLGNTLVDTSVPGRMTWMPGALRHLWLL
ncbi:MAG: hypothetical protein QOH03_2537, partial [Kribbellaceae bacterium]|nr:hypothetical protein [Kribbellaceae bacterium]